MHKSGIWWLKFLTHIGAWLPLAIIAYDFTQDNLTAEPVREITLRLGKTTFLFLIFSLTCTPVNIVFGVKWLIPLRRTLGLYTFFYANLHLIAVVGLDYAFDFALLKKDILEKRFALFGIAAYLCLLPLAITTGRKWAQRLGRKWERLHQLAYLAVLLAATHYIAQTKLDLRKPLVYATIVVVLLVLRIPSVRKTFAKVRSQFTSKRILAPP